MIRSGWLAAFALVLAPALALAQGQGGGMMQRQGGARQGMPGMGGMGGGMGMMGGGMGGGMGGMGGMMAANQVQARRAVRVELERGRKIDGHIELGSVRIAADLGSYAILPDKIASIRFLKVAEAPAAENAPEPPGAAAEGNLGQAADVSEVHVKAVTTTGDEIVGVLQHPPLFVIEQGFGTLVVQTSKLRSITFTDDEPKGAAVGAGARQPAGATCLGARGD